MSETATELIHPVYVDGPMKGRDYPLTGIEGVVYAADAAAPGSTTTYTLRRFGFQFGFLSPDGIVKLWVASSQPGEPDAEVLADLLLSDAAKAARA
jgi:hypothetical protein